MALDDVKGRLTEKAGPLPVWGWIALIGVVGYLYYRRKQTMAANAAANSTTGDTSATTGPTDYSSGLIGADYDLANRLAVLNSNVGNATTAITANTGAATTLSNAEEQNSSTVASNSGATQANTIAIAANTAAATRVPAKPTSAGKQWNNVYVHDVNNNLIYKVIGGVRFRVTQATLNRLNKNKVPILQGTDVQLRAYPLQKPAV